jgi:hypothetical protein
LKIRQYLGKLEVPDSNKAGATLFAATWLNYRSKSARHLNSAIIAWSIEHRQIKIRNLSRNGSLVRRVYEGYPKHRSDENVDLKPQRYSDVEEPPSNHSNNGLNTLNGA